MTRGGRLRRAARAAAALLLSAVAAVPAAPEDLEAAKRLYRDGRFSESILSLRTVVGELAQSQDLGLRRIEPADAYLHLGLSYVALGDNENARQAFKEMLRIDAGRRLDPEVYAPKVIVVFDEAQRAVATEAQSAIEPARTPGGAESGSPAAKKRSHLLPILAGAGAVGAGGLVLGLRGHSAKAPEPTFVPGVGTGSAQIVWLSALPAPGSTVPLQLTSCPAGLSGSCTDRLTISFQVTSPIDVPKAALHVELLNGGIECLYGWSVWWGGNASLVAGKPTTFVTKPLLLDDSCRPPFKTTSLAATLLGADGQPLGTQGFAGVYNFEQ